VEGDAEASASQQRGQSQEAAPAPQPAFRRAFAEVWREPEARNFTIFIFLSMLAYSAQDLILEPFAGIVFAYTPGQSTQLSGFQHGGVLIGMVLIGSVATAASGRWLGEQLSQQPEDDPPQGAQRHLAAVALAQAHHKRALEVTRIRVPWGELLLLHRLEQKVSGQ
jgi:hypothetical protein